MPSGRTSRCRHLLAGRGPGCETLELDAGDREVVDLLELREFEKIDREDRWVELCCLAEGDDVERDADGLERLD